MSISNIKGMFERAKDQWLCAVVFMSPQLKCRAERVGNVRNVVDLMLMHVNRREFYRRGHLLAYPSLKRLAFMAGLNEKTVRRAIDDLIQLGLIRVKHRFDQTSLYYLIIPPAAEEHSKMCLDLLTNPRLWKGVDKDSYDEQTPVSVQLHSEDALTLRIDKNKEAVRVSEGERKKVRKGFESLGYQLRSNLENLQFVPRERSKI